MMQVLEILDIFLVILRLFFYAMDVNGVRRGTVVNLSVLVNNYLFSLLFLFSSFLFVLASSRHLGMNLRDEFSKYDLLKWLRCRIRQLINSFVLTISLY